MDYKEGSLSNLIYKYLNNRLTPEEYGELWRILSERSDETPLNEELQKLWESVKADPPQIPGTVWDKKMQEAKQKFSEPALRPVISSFKRYRWAAAVARLGPLRRLHRWRDNC